MSENQYQRTLRARVASAIGEATSAAGFTHNGTKGTIVEILVAKLFRPLLPADIGIGTGQIIESYTGRQSTQMDIILYDRSILPPLLVDDKVGLFPIESVLYTIEVKTTLDAAELKVAHTSAADLHDNFGYRPGVRVNGSLADRHQIDKVVSAVFALRTTLKSGKTSEARRYIKMYSAGQPSLRAICIAGGEYWLTSDGRWWGGRDKNQYDGILSFIGGILNTYRTIADSRGRPLLGHYVIPGTMNEFPTIPI